MTELVALLSTGKGTWAEVSQLIKSKPWEKVYLITNDFGKEKFKPDSNTELLVVNYNSQNYHDDIYKILKSKIKGLEVAFNLSSGDGKEHMALVSALMRLGVGIRIVTLVNGEFRDLTEFIRVS